MMFKKILVNIVFCLLVLLFLISLFLTSTNHDSMLKIKSFDGIYSPIRINVLTQKGYENKVKICAQNVELEPLYMELPNHYVSYETNNLPVKYLAVKTDNLDKIENIIMTIGNDNFYFNKDAIKNFEKKDGVYVFSKDARINKGLKYINDKGFARRAFIYFMTFFHSPLMWIVSILFLLLAILTYCLNKDKMIFRFNFAKESAIWWILIICFLLRVADNTFPFWTDELYVITVAGDINSPFIKTFVDPGNPPLFFILAKFWIKLFGESASYLRILPAIISTFTVYFSYAFIRRNVQGKYSLPAAILSAFIMAIDVYCIQQGQNFRAYPLCMMLFVLNVYYLFEIINYSRIKDYIIYAVVAALIANTHYFGILLLIGNFIFVLFVADNKTRLKFMLPNLFAALLFLPYFIITALNKALLDNTFNQLSRPELDYILTIWGKYYYNNIVAVICSLTFLIYAVKKPFKFKEKDPFVKIYLYSFYISTFLFVTAFLISQIRPIIRPYYFVVIMPFIIFQISLFGFLPSTRKKIKYLITAFVLLFYLGGVNYLDNMDRARTMNFDVVFFWAKNEADIPKKRAIVLHDTMNYINFFKDYVSDEEFILYKYGKEDEIFRNILNSDAEIVYTRLEYYFWKRLIMHLSPYFESYIIRTNKDLLFAKFVRK